MDSHRVTDPCKVDEQGRTIIPKDIRAALGLSRSRGYVVYETDGEIVTIRRVEWSVK